MNPFKKILQNTFLVLAIIFLTGIVARFFYYPNDVYVAFDQTRDFYISLDVLHGKIKLVGPPSAFSRSFFHSPLIYYIQAPAVFLANRNPELISIFFRLFNSIGIILTFFIAQKMFNKKLGFIAALFFAISYEQSQYSFFMSHPTLGVVFMLVYYLGLAMTVFNKNPKGLIIAALGMGFAVQSHYSNALALLLIPVFAFVYKKELRYLSLKNIVLSIVIFLITVSPFLAAEMKYGFRISRAIFDEFSKIGTGSGGSMLDPFISFWITKRTIHDNIFSSYPLGITILFFVLTGFFGFYLIKQNYKKQTFFLLCWFAVGLLPYILTSSTSYYYSPASSVGILIFAAFLTYKLFEKNKILGGLVLVLILYSNFNLIYKLNDQGVNRDIMIQPEMLTRVEKSAMDYMYKEAKGQPFAVIGYTVPFNIDTTWSYLFEWYGSQKYGYVPIWGSANAPGFPGELQVENARSKLPQLQFLIKEPSVILKQGDSEKYFIEEGYFTKMVEEKRFGSIFIQKRISY